MWELNLDVIRIANTSNACIMLNRRLNNAYQVKL